MDEKTYSSSKLLVIMRTSYQYLILLSSSLIGLILLSDFMTIYRSAQALPCPGFLEKVEARIA